MAGKGVIPIMALLWRPHPAPQCLIGDGPGNLQIPELLLRTLIVLVAHFVYAFIMTDELLLDP